jgi:hypothetical protein
VPEFSCKPGEIVCVVGRVGAGKSSLVHAVLGNMHPVQGTAEAGGRVSYVPQNPWCQNLSLRDNITFGLPFDEEKYARVSVLLLLGLVMGSISHGGVNCSSTSSGWLNLGMMRSWAGWSFALQLLLEL